LLAVGREGLSLPPVRPQVGATEGRLSKLSVKSHPVAFSLVLCAAMCNKAGSTAAVKLYVKQLCTDGATLLGGLSRYAQEQVFDTLINFHADLRNVVLGFKAQIQQNMKVAGRSEPQHCAQCAYSAPAAMTRVPDPPLRR